jgi:hypothetical protein
MPQAKHITSRTPHASSGNAELGLAQAELNELVGLVLVYRNLGGGWQQ